MPDAPPVQTMLQVYEKYGDPVELWPHSAGSEPFYLFTQPPLSLPMVRVGLGHGAQNHAPDEYLVVEGNGTIMGLEEIEKAFVDFLFTLAGWPVQREKQRDGSESLF